MNVLLHGAHKVDAHGVREQFWLQTDGDRILRTGTGDTWSAHRSEVTDVIDVAGRTLTPGFIDLHCHGGGGYSFEDGTSAIRAALATHRAHGTTRSLVSLVSSSVPDTLERLAAIADLMDGDPSVLGTHLEGPFLAEARHGAHAVSKLVPPTADTVAALVAAGRGTLAQITIAPELPGAPEAIERFTAAGVRVAVGHTEADQHITAQAFDRGARILTHAFNAMNGIGHREPGPVMAAVNDERVTLEVIADGNHLAPDVVRLAFTLAPGRIALITDAMAAAGAPDGDYRLGSLDVDVRDGRATVRGTDTIAGSTLTLDAALRHAVTVCGIALGDAVTALTATPARALGRQGELGLLEPGYAADLVILDESLSVERAFANGRAVATGAR